MSIAMEIIQEVVAHGATLRADPPDIVITPPGLLSPELKSRIRANKPALFKVLQHEAELQASRDRLDAQKVSVAVWPDGSMRIVTVNAVNQAWKDCGIVFTPGEMFSYIRLSPEERKLIRDLKRLKP